MSKRRTGPKARRTPGGPDAQAAEPEAAGRDQVGTVDAVDAADVAAEAGQAGQAAEADDVTEPEQAQDAADGAVAAVVEAFGPVRTKPEPGAEPEPAPEAKATAKTMTLEKVRLEDPPAETEPSEDPPETALPAYEDDSGLMDALRRLKVRRDRTRDLSIGIGCGVAGLVIGLLVGHVTAGSGNGSTPPLSPGAAASRDALSGLATQGADTSGASPGPSAGSSTTAETITFTVTGSAPGGVLINYGTNSTGAQSTKLPFSASEPFDASGGILYYDVYAQLHGSGNLTCSISVNGTVVKSGTATTGSDICSAQIAPSAVTGQ